MEMSKFKIFTAKIYDLIKADYPELLNISDGSSKDVPAFDGVDSIGISSVLDDHWGEIEVSYWSNGVKFTNKTTISEDGDPVIG